MRYRRYSLEEKIKFLDRYQQANSIAEAARDVGVKEAAARYWIENRLQLRQEYERSLQPNSSAERISYQKVSLQLKLQCIRAIEAGLSFRQAAKKFHTAKSSVQNWYKEKEELLALYYTRQGEVEEIDTLTPSTAILEEVRMDSDQAEKDLARTIRAQAQEIEYLKDRVAFLENLNDILKERTGGAKKKNVLKQSKEALPEEEQT
jgi:transposase